MEDEIAALNPNANVDKAILATVEDQDQKVLVTVSSQHETSEMLKGQLSVWLNGTRWIWPSN